MITPFARLPPPPNNKRPNLQSENRKIVGFDPRLLLSMLTDQGFLSQCRKSIDLGFSDVRIVATMCAGRELPLDPLRVVVGRQVVVDGLGLPRALRAHLWYY